MRCVFELAQFVCVVCLLLGTSVGNAWIPRPAVIVDLREETNTSTAIIDTRALGKSENNLTENLTSVNISLVEVKTNNGSSFKSYTGSVRSNGSSQSKTRDFARNSSTEPNDRSATPRFSTTTASSKSTSARMGAKSGSAGRQDAGTSQKASVDGSAPTSDSSAQPVESSVSNSSRGGILDTTVTWDETTWATSKNIYISDTHMNISVNISQTTESLSAENGGSIITESPRVSSGLFDKSEGEKTEGSVSGFRGNDTTETTTGW